MVMVWSFLFCLVLSCVSELEARRPYCPRFCAEIYKPVCGTDGKTYSNLCKLSLASCKNPTIRFKHNGPCRDQTCSRPCTKIYKPVCGTDGKTYGNMCMFNVARCKNPSLRLKHTGRCRDPNKPCFGLASPLKNSKGKALCCGRCLHRDVCPRGSFCHIHPTDRFSVCCPNRVKPCSRPCTKIYKPVCGTDGKTYGNMCMFNVARCKNPSLRLKHTGRCRDPNKPCYGLASPLKNSKGKTLCCGRCLHKDVCPRGSFCHIHPTDRFSVCCPNRVKDCGKRCPKILKPVCASDGKTYNNKCLFEIAKCKNTRLRIVSQGRCRKVNIPGKCPVPKRCTSRSCRNRQKFDLCQADQDCRGMMKCCSQTLGKRCTRPCPVFKCRACPKGYKYALGSNGCPSCRCVCIRLFRCFVNPCQFAKCERYPKARCRANYCGGCKAEFYLGERKVNCKLPYKG